MTKTAKALHIFYSWQSDSPKATNLQAIRDGLTRACAKIEKAQPDIKLVPDEATRGTSGSPNIPLKILEKIDLSDIFVADVTTITPSGAERPCPNPNVSYELGYAVATLGWDRIILLFNEAHGAFPADLPFDFVQNRAKSYRLEEATAEVKRAGLGSFLENAINIIIAKNPKRPSELRGLSRERIAHERDVENMSWLMRSLHLPTLDDIILSLPHSFTDRSIWFFQGFSGVVDNSLFNLYDPVLKQAVDALFKSWTTTLAYDEYYRETAKGNMHVFHNPGDAVLIGKKQIAWEVIDSARKEMATKLKIILDRLRDDYMEINIHETNAKAWADYIEFKREYENPDES